MNRRRFLLELSLACLLLVSSCLGEEEEDTAAAGNKRVPRGARTLPSVSGDHYSEVLSDGTYKFAYTGEHRYVAERRLSDGTIEGKAYLSAQTEFQLKFIILLTRKDIAQKLKSSTKNDLSQPEPGLVSSGKLLCLREGTR